MGPPSYWPAPLAQFLVGETLLGIKVLPECKKITDISFVMKWEKICVLVTSLILSIIFYFWPTEFPRKP